jgi:hypothetical protein
MASVAAEATAAPSGGRRVQVGGATAAWLCAIPCAAVVAITMLVLGPPLGTLLTPSPGPYTFFREVLWVIHPEPTEQARYLIALGAPLLISVAVAVMTRSQPRISCRVADVAVIGTQLALVLVVVASLVIQYRLRLGFIYTRGFEATTRVRYFTPETLTVAALLCTMTVAVLWVPRLRAAAATIIDESRRRRMVIGTLALAATAIWMLHAVHSDAEIGNAVEDVRYNLAFTLDETFAVLNGRTPLVDFTAQYGSLWPFVIAVPMVAFGKTVLVYTIAACAITTVALLAVYGVLRRAARSATAAFLLYLPVLATSLFMTEGTRQNRSSTGSYYATFPLRYALPFLVAWLTARQLERERASLAAMWALFTVAGLGVLNNVEFGTAALGGSIAALAWTSPRGGIRRRLRQLGLGVACGLTTAFALLSTLTLARAGALPEPGRLVEYARTYVSGFAVMPIPAVLGVHLLIYLTYVAAIVVATIRRLRTARTRTLTGMLAWAGVFGLGAGMYWVGRSHPVALKHEFPAWALALGLLTVVAVRQLATMQRRRTAGGALVVLFGFGLMACSLAQTPTPWEQIERLNAAFVPTYRVPDADPLMPPRDPATRRFVASLADGRSHFVMRRGAPVAILLTTGHRVADAYGVRNVSPYTGIQSMHTVESVERALDALRSADGNTVILPGETGPGTLGLLRARGFELLTQAGLRPVEPGGDETLDVAADMLWPGGTAIVKLVDTRHLHPRALR